MTDWHERFLGLAEHIGTWSKDPSTKVGAVIVDPDKRIVSTGFNGWPRGIPDNPDAQRDVKLHRTLHAETNAILFAHRDLAGCTLYVTHFPCAACAAIVIQSGITAVVTRKPDMAFLTRWEESLNHAAAMFRLANVQTVLL